MRYVLDLVSLWGGEVEVKGEVYYSGLVFLAGCMLMGWGSWNRGGGS